MSACQRAVDAVGAKELPVSVNFTNAIRCPPSGSPLLNIVEDKSEYEIKSEADVKQRISGIDAAMHLIKGNLGPGCLNLPHAFALSGWLLGLWLFALVVIQGIYSMWLLAYCKQLLWDKNARTFMDVARSALGPAGGRMVQIFLFVLQGGVCCVFLSLISTNLKAQTGISDVMCIAIVTFVLLFMVLLRFIKDLRWLSATANVLMVVAISTAAVAGVVEFSTDLNHDTPKRSTTSAKDIATFVSSMYFSFEGIGLVLPVENSFTTGYSNTNEEKEANRKFRFVLIGAMSTVAWLFAWIGLSASIGYPDIRSGSITAFLEEIYPENLWFGLVNTLVMVAVLLTFPLQLTPAIEVLDEWFAPGCRPLCCIHEHCGGDELDGDVSAKYVKDDTSDAYIQDELLDRTPCFGEKEWIFRRWLMVLGCAVVVLLVRDLGVLISLFGAIGQTGLALMPCAIHLSLQRQCIAPRSLSMCIVDVFIIAFSVAVMITGFIFSMGEIIAENLQG